MFMFFIIYHVLYNLSYTCNVLDSAMLLIS